MALQINASEWSDIMKYIQQKLLENTEISRSLKGDTVVIQELTVIGIMKKTTLHQYLSDTQQKREKKKPQVTDDGFEKVWNTYPASGNFRYRGMQFTSSRTLRANKSVCEHLYRKGLVENNVTSEQIVSAIEKQLKLVKEESYEKGENKMQYMPQLQVYLRQSVYMAFIGTEVEEESEYNESSNCA